MYLPHDARYYFNICIIHISIRRSCGGEFEDIWDLHGLTNSRPLVYHFYVDEDENFEDNRKWSIEICHHCVLEVSDTLGVGFFRTNSSNEIGEFSDNLKDFDDFWRF